MSDNININVTENIDQVNIVASEIVEVVDLNLYATTEDVTINVTEEIIQVNINKVTGGSNVTKTSDLINDGEDGTSTYVETNNLGLTAFSNNYNDLDNLPTIPSAVTNTSDLINDGADGVNPFITLEDIPPVTGFVPYTGATQNVDLGEYEIKAGQVEFDQTPTGAAGAGVMRWNNTDGTLDLGLKGGNVTLQLGQEQVARVVNKTATNITLLESNYQVVKIIGATGQRLSVDLAQANNDLNSATTLGVVTETIANNQEGFITTGGQVKEINTTGSLQSETWADGDVLYLSPTTAGKITNIKPTAPNHTIIVGYVEYAHAIHGKIFVKVDNGYELEELHNVTSTNYTTPIDTDSVLTYDVTTSLWKRLSWSNIKSNLKTYFDSIYTTTSAVANQISTALVGYATESFVTSQGYITNVITALGFTPEDVANKVTDFSVINDTLYPSVEAVKEQLDSKLDKVSTAGVERVYTINTDGSQGTKPTSEFKDVLEFSNLAAFPVTGETGKIYLALDTNKTYRWSGSTYVQIGGGIDFPSDSKTYGVNNGLAKRIDLMFSNAYTQGLVNTSGGSAFGALVSAGNGSFSQGTLGNHGYYGSIPFGSISSASTLGSVANYRTMNWFTTTQNSFFVTETFVTISNSVAPLTSRMGIGYFQYTWQGNSNNNPSIFARICFCNDNGEDFLKLSYRESQSSSVINISLGSLFPSRFAKNEHVYFCKFYFLNNQAIATIFDLVTGNYYESPLLNCSWFEANGLAFVAHINNNTTAEVVSLGFNGFLNKFRYGF